VKQWIPGSALERTYQHVHTDIHTGVSLFYHFMALRPMFHVKHPSLFADAELRKKAFQHRRGQFLAGEGRHQADGLAEVFGP
jgi:hypothetical protein